MSDPIPRPWLDPALPVEQRVAQLLAVMTVQEKVDQLHQTANLDADRDRDLIGAGGVGSSLFASGATAGNERDAGVRAAAVNACQQVAVEQSRLGIPVLFGRDVIHGHRTVFPIPLGLAAGWNESLAERCMAVAAREAAQDGVAWTFAPMMDISEEPRWGRVAESLGEQPVLAGRLAAAMSRGFQGPSQGLATGSIAACAKHFVGYGLAAGGRDYNTVSVGENTLRNTHLRPFKEAVDAGCLTVMAAFNDVDGTPMHAHRHLVRDVLKGEWGFDGLVVADWNGISQLIEQGVAADLRDAARLALDAGVDLDMVSGAYTAHLADLVASGESDMSLLDDAARRVLRVKFRLGLFENPYAAVGTTDTPPGVEDRVLAVEAAAGSMVLLKNDGLLPLAADPGRVHLTGPFVHDGDALLGTWVLDGKGAEVVTPAAAFTARLGAEALVITDGRFSDVAVAEVRRTDVTVAVIGEHPSRSGEDRCISTLELPAGQLAVLEQLAALGKPLVVVVMTGRPLELGRVLEIADAVVLAWHPGTEAGTALVEVLFGDREPGGRLPMTFPRSVGHIPTSTLERPTGRPLTLAQEGRAGRYLDAPVFSALPFGFGLTYSEIRYGTAVSSSTVLPSDGGTIELTVAVTNTGRRAATETVQLYFRDPVAAVTRPVVELLDWQRVPLAPGASADVTFSVTAEAFGYFDGSMQRRVDTGLIELIVGPHSAAGQRLQITVG